MAAVGYCVIGSNLFYYKEFESYPLQHLAGSFVAVVQEIRHFQITIDFVPAPPP